MKRVLVLCLSGALLSACSHWPASSQDVPEQRSFLVHVVLVWLKQPGNPEHRQQIIRASQALRDIPGVQDLYVGEVVLSDRPVVEDSYDVALSLRFANAEDLQTYLDHPAHVHAVRQEFLPIMQRYQVIDFAGP